MSITSSRLILPSPFAGVALRRWRAPMNRTCELEDVFRVHVLDGAVVVTVANAFDSGFSTCWPEGSKALLDEFDSAFDAAGGPLLVRVAAAYVEGANSFLSRARTIPPFVPGDEDQPSGALAVAVITEASVRFLVRGGVEGLVVRGSAIVARAATRGSRDTVAHRIDAQALATVLDIPIETLSEFETREPSIVDVALLAGDRVLVGDWGTGSRLGTHRLTDLDDEALARRAVAPPDEEHALALGMAAVVGIEAVPPRT